MLSKIESGHWYKVRSVPRRGKVEKLGVRYVPFGYERHLFVSSRDRKTKLKIRKQAVRRAARRSRKCETATTKIAMVKKGIAIAREYPSPYTLSPSRPSHASMGFQVIGDG